MLTDWNGAETEATDRSPERMCLMLRTARLPVQNGSKYFKRFFILVFNISTDLFVFLSTFLCRFFVFFFFLFLSCAVLARKDPKFFPPPFAATVPPAVPFHPAQLILCTKCVQYLCLGRFSAERII